MIGFSRIKFEYREVNKRVCSRSVIPILSKGSLWANAFLAMLDSTIILWMRVTNMKKTKILISNDWYFVSM